MKKAFRKFGALAIIVLTILACSGTAPSASDLTATHAAAASPTPSATITSTPTQTPLPTRTPTPTTVPTATSLPVIVEPQDNGTTVVTNPQYGYQFVLPAGWELTSSTPSPDYCCSARYAETRLRATIDDDKGLESQLENRLGLMRWGFGFTIHREGITTNSNNTTLAFVESSGTFNGSDLHYYTIFFRSNGSMVEFTFHESIDSARPAISMIQDSIQLLGP